MAGSVSRSNMESPIVVETYVRQHREFMDGNETVREWLKRRPLNTQMCYANNLLRFCEYSSVTPDEFQKMEPKQARDLAWKFIDTLMDRPSVAVSVMSALKSFYRNHDGQRLPFDSARQKIQRVEEQNSQRNRGLCFMRVISKNM